MSVEIIGWIAPRVSSEIIPIAGPPFAASVITRTAKVHEDAGFDRVLIGYFSNAPDGFLGAISVKVTGTDYVGATASDTFDFNVVDYNIINGTINSDFLQGTVANDRINGLGGGDAIYADAGNDTIDGGTGTTYIEGGPGDDTYVYNRGYSDYELFDDSGDDTLQFGPGITPGDLIVNTDFLQNSIYPECCTNNPIAGVCHNVKLKSLHFRTTSAVYPTH